MKKNLALLLCLALCLSSLIGLTAYAEETETTLPAAPEIALVNVSIKSNVAMLFAVPMGDFTVNKDGTVDGLNLLVWKGESEYGKYGRGSADATLEAQGKLSFGGEPYVVFVYTGLTAKEMTDTVYARTVVSDGKSNIAYGKVIDYSITEWAKNYETSNGKNRALAENLLAYGTAMQKYRGEYKPNGYYAEDAKSLVTVTVNSKIAGSDEVVQKQVTQLAIEGSTITLAAPIVDGYSVSEWSVSDADAKTEGVQVKVDSDMEIIATFSSPATYAPAESMWSAEFDKIEKTYISELAGKGENMVGSKSSIRIHSGSVEYSDTNTAYVSYVPKADGENGENKYLCLSSTAGGAIYVNDGSASSIIPSNYNAKERGFLTIAFSLKRNEAGRIINSNGLKIRTAGGNVAEGMRVFNTKADGTVNIAVFKNGSINTSIETKVGVVAANGWSHFAFVVDFDMLKIYGYMKDENDVWQHKATSDVCIPANYTDIYDWLAKVEKMEWEFGNSVIDETTWESIVPELERQYVEDATLESTRKERLGEIVGKYFSVNIDNYEIFSGYAIN